MRKKQRIWAGLLSLVMALTLFSPLAGRASAAAPTVAVPPEITYATDTSAFLKDVELSQTGAWNLTVKANPTASGQTFAVLLRYDLFNANHNTDGSIGGINAGTYNSVAVGVANANYYRYQNATATNGTGLTIFNQTLYNFNSGNTGYQVTETSTTYHMKYALIIFDGGTNLENLSDYTIVTFYINSQGYLQTESYMLRYKTNPYPTGTTAVGSMPAYQIEGWGTDAAVNGTTRPTRVGYTFLGWDADGQLMNADANTAAAQTVTPQYPVGDTGPVPWSAISAEFGTTAFNKDSDKFYDLYAVWRPNKVEFDLANAPDEASVNGVNIHVLTLPSPQVGVAYSATISLGLAPNYTTDSGTAKGYSWQHIGDSVAFAGDDPGTVVNLTTAHQLSVASASNTSWRISGTPTAHSDGAPVYAVLQVTDNGNHTTDLIVLRFEEVKKGAQPIPTLDDNTGLQSRVVTSTDEGGEEVKDGQIYGFYSGGPVKDADGMTTGYWTGKTDGSGTMTNYYITNRMVYEYRPVRVGGETVDYTDTELPNDGWREMPMPSNWYTNSAINPVRTALENSLKKNATAVIKTGYAPTNNSYAPVTEVTTGLTASFLESGWPDSYGWIEYDGTLPILHGLTEDDQYEVRFRANDAYEVSKSQIITIGGAVAGEEPSGGSGLAVNLAGGEWKDADAAAAEAFVSAAAALTPGGTLTLPGIEPVRDGGYNFAGWTLGERDSDGRLILYRRGTTGTTPEEPKQVTVTWTAAGTTFHTAENVTLDGGKVPESVYPEETPGDIDTETEHKTFDKWGEPAVGEDGNITIAAVYKEKPEITYIWVDPLKDTTGQENPDDKTVGTPFTGYAPPAREQYPADPVHEGEAPFKEWVMGEPTTHPVVGSELGEGKAQVVITATYKEKATYVWVDPLKEDEDKTVQTVADAYDVPEHPTETPDHGEEHPFKEWAKGEPVTADGVTTVTFTATYKEKVTYIWVDPEIKGEDGEEPPSQVVATKESFDELTDSDYPAAPSHSGMDFKGWEVGEPVKGEDGTVTVTITAVYGRKVTYIWVDSMAEEGAAPIQTIADQFEKPEDPEAPEHEGWNFTGWEAGEPVTGEDGVTSVTITAMYEKDKWIIRKVTEITALDEFPASLAAVWDGGEGDSTPPDPSDFTAIVFYDWDETYLGSAVIAKTATASDIQKVLDEFVASKYSNYVEGMSFPADLENESWVNNSAFPLTYKKGYNFAGWVEVNGDGTPTLADAFTAYPEMGEQGTDGTYPENTFNAEKWNIPATPEEGWSGITLKAGYVENAYCNQGDGLLYYSTSQSLYGRPGTAAAGNYSISYTVTRENLAGNGVSRLRTPALRVTMAVGTTQIYILQYITNTDTTEVEIIVPDSLTNVSIALVDASEGSWLGAGIKAVNKAETSETYVKEGSITYINEAGIAAAKTPDGGTLPDEWNLNVDFTTANNAGLHATTGAAFTARNFTAAKTNLLAAFKAFVADPSNEGKVMTLEEMQAGIDTGTWTPSGS